MEAVDVGLEGVESDAEDVADECLHVDFDFEHCGLQGLGHDFGDHVDYSPQHFALLELPCQDGLLDLLHVLDVEFLVLHELLARLVHGGHVWRVVLPDKTLKSFH